MLTQRSPLVEHCRHKAPAAYPNWKSTRIGNEPQRPYACTQTARSKEEAHHGRLGKDSGQ